jgi:uncharacterized membrane protein
MVAIQETDPDICIYTLQSNCALGWARMKLLFLFLSACIASVALYFIAQGAWLILPFAGLEMLVLAIGIYLNSLWCSTRESIEIDGPDLRICKGRNGVTNITTLPRHWVQMKLQQDPSGWYPSKLYLACHGMQFEIAALLVEDERLQLAKALKARLNCHVNSQQTKPNHPSMNGIDVPGLNV